MSDDELSRKVAELCGVKFCSHEELREECCKRCGWNPIFFPYVDVSTFQPIKDYCSDLNAMFEAEEQAPHIYWKTLADLAGSGMHSIKHRNLKALAHAAPRQRAEAFVLAKEKAAKQ